jgi:hypothetical protein
MQWLQVFFGHGKVIGKLHGMFVLNSASFGVRAWIIPTGTVFNFRHLSFKNTARVIVPVYISLRGREGGVLWFKA